MEKYEKFDKAKNGFNYSYEKVIPANTTLILKMPPVSANKRGINDIGFAVELGVTLYATIAAKPLADTAVWQEIHMFDEINKTTSFIKIVNSAAEGKKVNIRAILY